MSKAPATDSPLRQNQHATGDHAGVAGAAEDKHEQASHPQAMPGELGVWIFIFGDLCVFALFFGTYIFYRAADPIAFAAGQQKLSLAIGATNTIILLSSSALVMRSLEYLRDGRKRAAELGLGLATGVGALFIVLKTIEYSAKFRAGITPTSSLFFNFYFMLTGIHLFHVIVGIFVLVLMSIHLRNSSVEQANIVLLESGASFWHMVDVVWILLFPLLYVIV